MLVIVDEVAKKVDEESVESEDRRSVGRRKRKEKERERAGQGFIGTFSVLTLNHW